MRPQVALLLVSGAVLPLTTAVLPTNPSAWVDCVVCCSDTRVASELLVLSCCCTPANSTSCWVNWLVSSGSSGFWFCNCVVSSSRKLWKLPAICCEASALAAAADELDEDDAGRVRRSRDDRRAVFGCCDVLSCPSPQTLMSTPLLDPSMRP